MEPCEGILGGPKGPYFDYDFAGAKFIWTDDLELDNTVIFRFKIDGPLAEAFDRAPTRFHKPMPSSFVAARENEVVVQDREGEFISIEDPTSLASDRTLVADRIEHASMILNPRWKPVRMHAFLRRIRIRNGGDYRLSQRLETYGRQSRQ